MRSSGRQEEDARPAVEAAEQEVAPPSPPEEASPTQPTAAGSAGEDREAWLRLDFEADEDAPPFEEEAEEGSLLGKHPILAPGIPGLLTPVRVTAHDDETDSPPPVSSVEPAESQVDLWRRARTRISSPPLLAGLTLHGTRTPLPELQIRWLFLILALAITIPAFFQFAWPSGSAAKWPGVDEAFLVVDGLPANATVLVYWAYDPSTSGEVDLAALPVTEHLLQQRAKLAIITQLPGGPATARQLVDRARLRWQRTENLAAAAQSTWTIPIVYLPGGASILALIGQHPGAAFLEPDALFSPAAQASAPGTPDLSVVFAAQADDVQHWLEQVQPFNQAPVLAVVGAGADPALRPYLDSGQVVGLVSGFDGAFNYQRLLDKQAGRADTGWLDSQLVLQDWGQFVFFLAIVLGNFASVLSRGQKG